MITMRVIAAEPSSVRPVVELRENAATRCFEATEAGGRAVARWLNGRTATTLPIEWKGVGFHRKIRREHANRKITEAVVEFERGFKAGGGKSAKQTAPASSP